MSASSEFDWQPWAVALAGTAAAAMVLPTISFPLFADYLLFLVEGAVLAEVVLAVTWAAALLLMLPVAVAAHRRARAPGWAAQATRWLICAVPLLAATPIAFNRTILLGRGVERIDATVIVPLAIGLGLCVVMATLRIGVSRLLARPRGRWTLTVGIAACLVAAAATGWWTGAEQPWRPVRVAEDPPYLKPPARPVLVVGVDSLGRETLANLVASGDLPTFRRLLSRGALFGIRGESVNSCELFTTMATAAPAASHEVLTHLHVKFPGITSFPVHESYRSLWLAYALGVPLLAVKAVEAYPPPRDRWHVEPIWTRAHKRGLSTTVVGWLGSWPPQAEDGDVFPYLAARSSWEVFYRYRPGRFAASGCFAEAPYRALVREPSEADADGLAALGLDRGAGVERRDLQGGDLSLLHQNPINYVRYEWLGDVTHAAMAERAIRERQPDASWVYFGGLDVTEHFFWPCWQPEAYPDGPGRPVPPRERQPVLLYYKWIDEVLGRLIEAYREPPMVIVVGDHDMAASPGNRLFPAWHSGQGALVVWDPSRSLTGSGTVVPEDVGDLAAACCGLGTSGRWTKSPLRGLLGR